MVVLQAAHEQEGVGEGEVQDVIPVNPFSGHF